MRYDIGAGSRGINRILILLLAAVGLYSLIVSAPWAIPLALRAATGWPARSQSSYYSVRVANRTDMTLLVTLYNLNDKQAAVQSVYWKTVMLRVGREREAATLLVPGAEAFLSLPSLVRRDIGLLLLTVQTDLERGVTKSQRFQAYLLPRGSVSWHVPEAYGGILPEDYPTLSIREDNLWTIVSVPENLATHYLTKNKKRP